MAVAKRTKKILTKAQRVVREKKIIRDLHGGKLSYRQIAMKHRVSLPTVNAKARKAGIRRRGRGVTMVAGTRIAAKATKQARVSTRRYTRRTGATRRVHMRTGRRVVMGGGRSMDRFNEHFRRLVMNYYPSMPLVRFERLTRMVRQAVTI